METESGLEPERAGNMNGKNQDHSNISNRELLKTQGGSHFKVLASNIGDDLINEDIQIVDDEEVIPKDQRHEMKSEPQPLHDNDVMVEDSAAYYYD